MTRYGSRGRSNNERNSGVRRFSAGRLPVLFTAAVVGYLLFSLSGQFFQLSRMESQVRGMQQQVKTLQAKNQSLQNELKNIKSDAYIEQVARQRLGLVKPGEYPVRSVTKGVQHP